MSRIGQKPVPVPGGVDVLISGRSVKVKGPKGELSLDLTGTIQAKVDDGAIQVERGSDNREERAKHGLYRSLINNMVIGVAEGFKKELEIMSTQRASYRAELNGDKLVLDLGFSSKNELPVPKDVEVAVKGNIITVSGIDKQKVGQFAASIRMLRPPDVYRDRGVKYRGEWVRRIKIQKFGVA